MIFGEVADGREKFEGMGAQLRCLPTHLEACEEDDLEVVTRLAVAECDLM